MLLVRFDNEEKQTGKLIIILNASNDSVPFPDSWGADEIIWPVHQDETNQMIDSIINNILTNSSQLNKVCLVTVYPYDEVELMYFQR